MALNPRCQLGPRVDWHWLSHIPQNQMVLTAFSGTEFSQLIGTFNYSYRHKVIRSRFLYVTYFTHIFVPMYVVDWNFGQSYSTLVNCVFLSWAFHGHPLLFSGPPPHPLPSTVSRFYVQSSSTSGKTKVPICTVSSLKDTAFICFLTSIPFSSDPFFLCWSFCTHPALFFFIKQCPYYED